MYSSTKPCALFREHSDLLHFHGYQYLVTLHLLIFAGKSNNKTAGKIRRNDSLPFHADIENHPPARLPSRHPVWLGVPREDVSALDEWCDEWLGTDVINQSLVDDSTALPPGFNLPRHLWANLNHFRTGQGQCAANLARWHKIPDPSCTLCLDKKGSRHYWL